MSEDRDCSEDKKKIKKEVTHWRKLLKFGLTLEIYIQQLKEESISKINPLTIVIAFVGFYWDAGYG